MIPFKNLIKTPLKNTGGFTFVELMVVFATIGILAAVSIYSYMPQRAKAMDSSAQSNARNMVSSIVDAIMNDADIDFDKGNWGTLTGTGGAIGDVDTGGNAIDPPVFVMSEEVEAVIRGNTDWGGTGNTRFEAFIYHTGGSDDSFSLTNAGKREYYVYIDEATGVISVPE